jgi:nitrite reductase/ring-hydroxylating ferredoxin subunit
MAGTVRLARLDEIGARTMNVFDVSGERIAVAVVEGAYYGFEDACPHLQCRLSEGTLSGQTVSCPCHGSEFDVTTGERLAGPARRSLRTYAVRVSDGGLEIVADDA